jgi:hypothetical protein
MPGMVFFRKLIALWVVFYMFCVVNARPIGPKICYSSRSDGMDCNLEMSDDGAEVSVKAHTVGDIVPRQDSGYYQTEPSR